jgi:hypothetical protein
VRHHGAAEEAVLQLDVSSPRAGTTKELSQLGRSSSCLKYKLQILALRLVVVSLDTVLVCVCVVCHDG